jgi:hypothetical protein
VQRREPRTRNQELNNTRNRQLGHLTFLAFSLHKIYDKELY